MNNRSKPVTDPTGCLATGLGAWECHLEPDRLLIWTQEADGLVLTRTGTHSDLFG